MDMREAINRFIIAFMQVCLKASANYRLHA